MNERIINLKEKIPRIALIVGLGGTLISCATNNDDEPRFNILKPAVVTGIETRERIVDDFYINGTYMGVVISPHITLEQCDEVEVDSCSVLDLRISSVRPETIEQLEVGDTVRTPEGIML